MKFTLQTSDDLYDHYHTQAESMQGNGASVTPEEVMADRLERFKDVSPSDRVVVIDPKSRQALEQILSYGSLQSAEDLVKKVESLASIRIGDIRLDFTPGQMRELANVAKRNRKTVEEVIKETVERMESLFFNHVGA